MITMLPVCGRELAGGWLVRFGHVKGEKGERGRGKKGGKDKGR